jgi:RNA polymerase sigma factor (sigma-70 family)
MGISFARTNKPHYQVMRERIAPADVVSFIDEVFPGMAQLSVEQAIRFRVTSDWLPQLSAILHLVDRISERLPCKRAYIEVVATAAAIRAIVVSWMLGNHDQYLQYLPGLGAHHPIVVLRQALLNSSDCFSGAANLDCVKTGLLAEDTANRIARSSANGDFHPKISALTQRQREVIELRYKGLSLQAIGICLGISGERVRQIEARVKSRARLAEYQREKA